MSNASHGSSSPAAPVDSLARELDVSLAALRASLEDCRAEATEPRARTLEGALDELRRLARVAHELIDVARPAPLAPLRCTTRELVAGARQSVPREVARRVETRSLASAAVRVDGPVVIRSLAYLLESAAGETGGPIALDVRAAGGEVHFSVSATPAPATPPTGDELELAALALALARRDVERSGGRLVVEDGPADVLRATIALPAEVAS